MALTDIIDLTVYGKPTLRALAETAAIDRAIRVTWSKDVALTFPEHLRRFEAQLERHLDVFLKGFA